MLIGSGGAGKSMLARALGEVLQVPVYHLDALFWHAGWIESPKEKWRQLQAKLCAKEAWILDGNYGGTMDIRLAASDTIIFLDMPRWLCLYRVAKRAYVFHGRSRPDMAPGCPERIEFKFLKWIWDYPRARRPGILEQLERLKDQKEIFIFRSPREAAAFVERLRAEVGTAVQPAHAEVKP